MTGEEMERAIAELITQQRKTANALETLVEQQADFNDSLTRFEQQAEADRREMRESVATLATAVGTLATQMDADRQIINNRMERFDGRMERFERQAEADRAEIRDAIGNLAGRFTGLEGRRETLEEPRP